MRIKNKKYSLTSFTQWGGSRRGFLHSLTNRGGLGWGFILSVLFVACTTDSYETGDGKYSLLTADFCMAHSSEAKQLDYALLDTGDSLRLSPVATAEWATTKDSLYRTLLYYNVSETKTVKPYSAVAVNVLRPSTKAEVTGMPMDPLTLTSSWLGGGYLNLNITLKTGVADEQDAKQKLGLACDSISAGVYYLRLVHDQAAVPEYYSVSTYASIPLASFPKGSTLRLRIPTYKGEVVKEVKR